MQPQQPASSNPSPLPPSQFDFILGGNQKPKNSFKMPGMNLPKPARIAIAVTFVIILLLIVSSVFFSKQNAGSQSYAAVAARAHEIARVSTLVNQQSQDPNTKALAATVQTTLLSGQIQIAAYSAKQGTKVSPTSLISLQDKNSDSQISTAAANNNLTQVYSDYLKTNLAAYQSALQNAYKNAGTNGRAILSSAYASVGVIKKNANL